MTHPTPTHPRPTHPPHADQLNPLAVAAFLILAPAIDLALRVAPSVAGVRRTVARLVGAVGHTIPARWSR